MKGFLLLVKKRRKWIAQRRTEYFILFHLAYHLLRETVRSLERQIDGEIGEMFRGGREREEKAGSKGCVEEIDSLSSVKEGVHSALAILYEHIHTHVRE